MRRKQQSVLQPMPPIRIRRHLVPIDAEPIDEALHALSNAFRYAAAAADGD
jgi:hypothetical protein